MPKASERKPKEPKPWRRVAAGRYRSADERFEIEDADGRWFVRDETEHDELGLPRTLGPFGTLDAARDAADAARSAPAAPSPLAGRLEAARTQERAAASRTPRGGAGSKGRPAGERTAAHPPRPPEPPPPPEPSWLDSLPAQTAAAARRTIRELEKLGFRGAERLVRTDATTETPSVARALLARRLVERGLGPWRGEPPADGADAFAGAPDGVHAALRRAHAAGLDDTDIAAFARFVAERTLGVAVEEVAASGSRGAARELPGWELVERPPDDSARHRTIDLSAADLTAEADGTPEA